MNIELFDYSLPEQLIAKEPLKDRTKCRLLVLNRLTGEFSEAYFYELTSLINDNYFFVINNTKVNNARLVCTKQTGGHIEVLLLDRINEYEYLALVRGKINKPLKVSVGNYILTIDKTDKTDVKHIYFDNAKASEVMETYGSIPIPPYFRRQSNSEDRDYYQTVYAKVPGSAAAPTAGLHFDAELLEQLKKMGIEVIDITLNVSYSTFKPIKCKNIDEHKMYTESYYISDEAAYKINEQKKKGKKLIAVGTTVVRAIESAANEDGFIEKTGQLNTNLFIKTGYRYKIVDSLITNFHLPKSTLLVLVAAFAGLDNIKRAYDFAIKNKYRFYSYGDAMFLY